MSDVTLRLTGGLLCGQCGEQMAAMVKVGTNEGWCVDCLNKAAEPVTAESTGGLSEEERVRLKADIAAGYYDGTAADRVAATVDALLTTQAAEHAREVDKARREVAEQIAAALSANRWLRSAGQAEGAARIACAVGGGDRG